MREIVEKFDERDIDQQLTVDLVAHIMATAEYVSVEKASVQRVISTMIISWPALWRERPIISLPTTRILIVSRVIIGAFRS